MHDLKIKLPIFILPLIYGTSLPLSNKELRYIFHFYLLSVLLAILISTAIFLGLTPIKVVDIRNISPIISHIRLSLIIVLAFYFTLYYLFFIPEEMIFKKYVYYILLLFYLSFTITIGATTGLVILLLVFPFAVLFWLKKLQNRRMIMAGIITLFIITGFSLAYPVHCYFRYMKRETVDRASLPKRTVNGNRYYNDIHSKEYENKYPVWIEVCEKELGKEWAKRSKIPYKGKDLKGQSIRYTLIRYITSLGYTKDSAGCAKLTDEDISMIEMGVTNYIFKNKLALYPRFYQIFWEIEHYMRGGNPGGHSITQRFAYLKNSFHVIRRNFWFGTGTGDTEYEIQKQYVSDHSKLKPHWRRRAHNQLVTFFLTFGIFGFIWIITAFTLALRSEKRNIDFIFICFLLIFLFSTLNEDTLETQIGATFFALFLSLLLLGRNLSNDKKGVENDS
jgi:O-antigen ligase